MTARLAAAWRWCADATRAFWPFGAPGYVLLGLVVAGAILRLVAVIAWWPTATTLADSAIYAEFAASNPFGDPQHPAGYGVILAGLGAVTREVAVPIFLQHLSGIVSALLLFAATRRVSGSAWAGLLPAAIVLLNPDLILHEHAIMSESWSVLATSAGLYAAVRGFDEPHPWWRWPLICGAALGSAVTIRTAGLFVIPVAVLALFLSPSQAFRRWREHLRAPVAAGTAAALVLLAFATANATFGERFGIGPSPGWYLYGRVAQFADCDHFTPPPGTDLLCEDRPANERPGAKYYLFDPSAPVPRAFGAFGTQNDAEIDDLLGDWSRRAIRAQPGDYLSTAWTYLSAYWFPPGGSSDLSAASEPLAGGGADPYFDFTAVLDLPIYVAIQSAVEQNMEHAFYNGFTIHQYGPGLEFLRGWQHFARFGATLLSVTTLLTLLGLFIGTRRSRVGVVLFGIGGLALIIAPALTATYSIRYTIPMAGPLMAAAAIAIVELWRWAAARIRFAGTARHDPMA